MNVFGSFQANWAHIAGSYDDMRAHRGQGGFQVERLEGRGIIGSIWMAESDVKWYAWRPTGEWEVQGGYIKNACLERNIKERLIEHVYIKHFINKVKRDL